MNAKHGRRAAPEWLYVLPVMAAPSFAAACSPPAPRGEQGLQGGWAGASGMTAGGTLGAGLGGAAGLPTSAGSGGSSGSSAGGMSGADAAGAGMGGNTGGNSGSMVGGDAGSGGNSAGRENGGSGGSPPSGGAGNGGGLGGSPGGQGGRPLPDPGPEGDGKFEIGPNYTSQPDLTDRGAPKGRSFQFSMALADSEIFDGTDATLDPSKPVNSMRSISVYVPAQYAGDTPAPVLVIQDGPGELSLVRNALDNLTIAQDTARRVPPFVAVAVQNGGNNSKGSERGLEYDTMSDRYARFIHLEVLPAVEANASIKAAYPSFTITRDPNGRAALGCSSGGAAALTMGWFRPDLFRRLVTYSGTFVDQQDDDAPEETTYPFGAWEYHSGKELIANEAKKELRVFLTATENDLGANEPESTHQNWVMANERTAAALEAKGYHYRYVFGRGASHCDSRVLNATLADALIWIWRGYQPSAE